MQVRSLDFSPDVAPSGPRDAVRDSQAAAFGAALDALGAALDGAARSEDGFAHGTRSLASAVYERARADVALAVATATAQRCAQALSAVANMQV